MKNKYLFLFPSLIALGGQVWAQSIANPGFEADTFGTPPGYITGALNGPITGWTASSDSRIGLNPSFSSPFANNGVIPEGANVAFIQATDTSGAVTLSSTDGITGLEIGTTYNLSFRVNSRLVAGNLNPEFSLFLQGLEVLRNTVNAVGGANEYKTVSHNFVATAETMSLEIDVVISGDSTDESLLVDDFVIREADEAFTFSAWNGDATSGIDDSLTYTHAFNLGQMNGMETDAVVNGVNFTGIGGGNPSVAGSFSLDFSGRLADGNTLTTGTDGSAVLASAFVFGNARASLVLEGLTPGARYRTSLFSVGFGNDIGRNSTFVGTSSNGDQLTAGSNAFGNNNGVRLDYEFVATGTTETVSITALEGGSTFHTSAFANALLGEAPDEIVINDCSAAPGTNSGQLFTLDFTAGGDVDVYASSNLIDFSLVASDVSASPFVEDDVADLSRFYVLVAAGTPFPPVADE